MLVGFSPAALSREPSAGLLELQRHFIELGRYAGLHLLDVLVWQPTDEEFRRIVYFARRRDAGGVHEALDDSICRSGVVLEDFGRPDPLRVNLGSVNSEPMGIALHLSAAINGALAAGPPALERLPALQPAVETYLKVTRQIDRLAQLELRAAPQQGTDPSPGATPCAPGRPARPASPWSRTAALVRRGPECRPEQRRAKTDSAKKSGSVTHRTARHRPRPLHGARLDNRRLAQGWGRRTG